MGIRFPGADTNSGDRVAFGLRGICVPEELVGVLKNLSRADRGEPAPPAPAAEDEARRQLPSVLRTTLRARSVQGRMRSFPELLKASTPRVVATPALVALCVLTFAIMQTQGAPRNTRDVEVIWAWGGSFGPSVLLDGETWRLLTSMFVHVGILHLVFNMWCLLLFGPLVERLYGTLGFATLYLISGLGGALASLWYHPMVVSAGASGAIFGVFGGLIGYLVVRRDVSPTSVVQLFRPGFIIYLVVDSLLGLADSRIDGAAHLGGLATGCVCGLVLNRPWPPSPTSSDRRRRLAGACLLVVGLLFVYQAAARGGRAGIERDPKYGTYVHSRQNALADYTQFAEAIEPVAREFDAISGELDVLVQQLDWPFVAKDSLILALDRLVSRADSE